MSGQTVISVIKKSQMERDKKKKIERNNLSVLDKVQRGGADGM